MIRTEADGATVDNKYSEGNPALSIPATVVGGPEMNSIQEELAKAIERYGIALQTRNTDDQTQLFTMIERMHTRGGRPTPVSMNIANNQAAAADIVGFPNFNTTTVRSVEFLYTAFRSTDTGNLLESGRCYMTWNPATLAWEEARISGHAGAGITFSMAVVAGTNYKLQYVSDNLAGPSYLSKLTITDIKELRV